MLALAARALSRNTLRTWDAQASDADVILLGTVYGAHQVDQIGAQTRDLLYFTYRSGFSHMEAPAASLDNDAGWGCVHRAGQMMLALCLDRLVSVTAPEDADTRKKKVHDAMLSGYSNDCHI